MRLYLFASALIGFTAFGGVYPVLYNLYLLRLGYGPEFVGTANAVFMLGYALLSPLAGGIGDRLGCRRSMVLGMVVITLGYVTQPWAGFVAAPARATYLIATRLLGAFGLALLLVNSNPLMMGSTTEEDRTHAYSARSAAGLVAGFAGSLIAGGLPSLFGWLCGKGLDDPAPYAQSLFAGALMLVPGIWAMAQLEPLERTGEDQRGRGPGARAVIALILVLCLIDVFVLCSEGVARTFFNVYLDTGLTAPTPLVGGIYAVAQLVALPAALATPLASQRWGTAKVVAISSWGMMAALIPLALIPHWAAAALAYVVIIAFAQIRVPAVGVYQMESVPPAWRTHMAGAAGLALGLSWTAISYGGGALIPRLGYASTFLISAALTLVGALAFSIRLRGIRDSD